MGQPTAVKVFMMWQKLIQGLCAKSNPDVNPMVSFCGINGSTKGTTFLRYVKSTAFPPSQAEGMLSII